MPLVTKTFSDIITFTRTSGATYFDSNGVLQTAGNNVPRLDYNPSTLAAQGLLIEEQRTNILASSVYTANANGWTNGVIGGTGTIVAAAVNSPAGTADGVFNISGLNGSSYVGNFVTTTSSSNARTGSVFVKNNGGVKFQIRLNFGGVTYVSYGTEYDFNTGTFQDGIAGTTAPTSRSVTNVGNGWLRITITGSDNGSGNTQTQLLMFGTPTTTNYNYLFWGAQVEQGASGASAAFPTSCIPTTTTALTRSADVASVNTLSPWYNATAGTLFAQVSLLTVSNDASRFAAALSDGTTANYIGTFRQIDQQPVGQVVTGGAAQAALGAGAIWTTTASRKLALSYATNDFKFCTNGGTVFTDTAGTVPTVTQLQLGTVGGAVRLNGWLERVTFYPRVLSSAELQAITA